MRLTPKEYGALDFYLNPRMMIQAVQVNWSSYAPSCSRH